MGPIKVGCLYYALLHKVFLFTTDHADSEELAIWDALLAFLGVTQEKAQMIMSAIGLVLITPLFESQTVISTKCTSNSEYSVSNFTEGTQFLV